MDNYQFRHTLALYYILVVKQNVSAGKCAQHIPTDLKYSRKLLFFSFPTSSRKKCMSNKTIKTSEIAQDDQIHFQDLQDLHTFKKSSHIYSQHLLKASGFQFGVDINSFCTKSVHLWDTEFISFMNFPLQLIV